MNAARLGRRAFTLVELLVVITIFGVLSALVAPSITQVLTARNLDRAVMELAAVLEESRARAVSRNSYIFVGLENGERDGNGVLALVALESPDGSATIAASGMRELTRPRKFNGVHFVERSTLGSDLEAKLAKAEEDQPGSVDLAGTTTITLTDRHGNTFSRVLIFSPQGELIVSGAIPTARTPYTDALVIGLRTVRGTTPSTDANAAALRMQGGSGSLQIFKL